MTLLIRKFVPLFVATWLICALSVDAQQPLSSGAGGYGGLNAAFVNPAHLSYNWTPWGINLPSASVAFQNNGLRADYFSGIAALFGRSYSVAIDNAASRQAANTPDILIRNLRREESAIYTQLQLQLLGGYIHWGYHSFGIGVGNRAFFDLRHIGSNLMRHFTEGILFDSLKNVPVNTDGIAFNGATFSEIQLAWSWRFLNHRNRSASIGVVAKPIFGYGGVHAQFDRLTYTVTNTDTFRVDDFSGSYANALTERYFQGLRGIGFDLGYEFVAVNPNGPNDQQRSRTRIDCTPFGAKLRRAIRPIPNHYWRLGVSLLDLGFINANALEYIGVANNVSASVLDPAILNGQRPEPFFINLIQNQGRVISDTTGYTVGLATALGVQYDVWITDRYYLHASLVQRLPFIGNYSLFRLNQLMVAPRFESTWFEFGLPMSLYEYRHVQLGLWARIGPLTFGTDRLGELFGFRRAMGADAYASINLLPLWK